MPLLYEIETDKRDKHEYAACSRAFDRVIDVSEVKSLLLWPDDFGGGDMVEVEIQ